MTDPGVAANSQLALTSANITSQFAGMALPAIRQIAGSLIGDLGSPGTEPASVRAAFDDARTNTNQDYNSAATASRATLEQSAKQSGGLYNPSAMSDSMAQLNSNLTQSRASSLRSLAFQEAQTGQEVQTNELNQLIGLGSSTMQGSLGFGSNAAGANQLLSQIYAQQRSQDSTYGALGGTLIGGLLGSVVPGVGTMAGAGLGGALGGGLGGILG